MFIKGTFEDAKYFDAIKSHLFDEFEPKYPILEQNVDLYELISSSNSVCVSVRSFKEIQGDQNTASLYNVCTPKYFDDAIKLICKKIEKPVFFIFSDDIEWTKSKLSLRDCTVYYETTDNPVWEKLRLMYTCKHFILSNSTFSWWTQYLSRNENKIVISPSRWFNDDYKSPLIDESWIKI
ncbi:MAG: hypothetical protein DI598_16115 [Pseudopedobacter saltans]|uniref:Alpha-1,2-fucosyltransferase n=1 Tax=Pseudopedobacter saltans TaxID=151895 RepID=A0A2W5EFK9_9SPHI|nr:MAG: hypothetical protein DI598_16115 [Pseudopedobacter saltans]